MSQFAKVHNKHPDNEPNQYDGNGAMHFNDVSTPSYIVHFYGKREIKLRTNFSVSSTPVDMCLCSNNKNNIIICTQQTSVNIEKRETFTMSLVAIDQIGQPVNATIQTNHPQLC